MRGSCRTLRALSFTLLVMLTSSRGADAGTFSLDLAGGMVIPTADAGDALQGGFSGGVRGQYWANEQFAIGVEIAGDFPPFDDAAVRELNDFTEYFVALELLGAGASDIVVDSDLEPSLNVTHIGLGLTWRAPALGSRTRPFLRFGGGVYNVRTRLKGTVFASYDMGGTPVTETEAVDLSESEGKMGFSVTAGVLREVSPTMAVGLEAGYHNVFDGLDEETSLQQLRVLLVLSFTGGARGDGL